MLSSFADGVIRIFTTKRNLKCHASKLVFAIILKLLLMSSSQSAAQEDFTVRPPSGTTSESTDRTGRWRPNEQNDARATLRRNKTETVIWGHHCSRKSIRYWSASFPVIFSCVPISLLHATGSYKATDHSFQQTEKFGSRPTRVPKRALVNASLQFDVPMGVTDLRLWYQDIVSVEDNAFLRMRDLKLLNLQHNDISYLSQRAFAGKILWVTPKVDGTYAICFITNHTNNFIGIHKKVIRYQPIVEYSLSVAYFFLISDISAERRSIAAVTLYTVFAVLYMYFFLYIYTVNRSGKAILFRTVGCGTIPCRHFGAKIYHDLLSSFCQHPTSRSALPKDTGTVILSQNDYSMLSNIFVGLFPE